VSTLVSLGYILDEAATLKGKRSDWRGLVDRYRQWVEDSLTPAGLLRDEPSQTITAAGLLIDLREKLLGNRGWSKGDSKVLGAMLSASSHSLFQGGSLFLKDEPSRKVWKKRWKSLAADKNLAEPASVGESLLRDGKLKSSLRSGRELGIQCDPSGWTVLRGEWTAGSPMLAIESNSAQMQVEFRLRGVRVARGAWTTSVTIDGQQVDFTAPWENVGWNSDESGQYVEFRKELGGGAWLERLVFLARATGLLFLLDTVGGTKESGWRVESSWITSEWKDPHWVSGFRALETTLSNGMALRALPLGCAPTSREPSAGAVRSEEGFVRWWLESRGERMAIPMVFAWDKKGLGECRPWRQLTVTNDGPVMSSSEAAAYRFLHQGKNIILFRSLIGTRRMAFMGHQTFYETLIGEFKKDGTVKDWLSVDADPETPWDYFGALKHRQHIAPHGHEVQRDR
jgi:hypothetical protein